MADAPDLVVVANPAAGHGGAGRLVGVTSGLHRLRVPHGIRVSESGPDLERLARAPPRKGRIVAALGGDGGLSRPRGSWARAPRSRCRPAPGTTSRRDRRGETRTAIELLANPKTVDLDVIEVTTGSARRSYVNIAGAGFDSEVNETANGMRVRLGATGTYVAALLKTLSKFSPAAFTIQVDDERLELDAMLVEIGSGRWTGRDAGPPGRVHERRTAGRLHRGGALEARVPPRLPARVHRLPHDPPEGADADRDPRPGGGEPARAVYADGELVGPLPAIFESVRPRCSRWWSARTPRPYGER